MSDAPHPLVSALDAGDYANATQAAAAMKPDAAEAVFDAIAERCEKSRAEVSADVARLREADAPLATIRMIDVVAQRIVPVWPGVLYRGKVTLIAGVPGDGKSLLAEDLAARISSGGAWPCGAGKFTAANVLLLTAEDDPADTIRPRLDVAGADCSKVVLIQGARVIDQRTKAATLSAINLLGDLPCIEQRIAELGAKLLIIDPLTSFAASDNNKAESMRPLFDALAAMATRTGVAVLIITHLNKRSDATRAMHMVSGSHVIVAAVRVALVTARDPEDPARRLLLPVKLNIASDDGGFAFRILPTPHAIAGEVPRADWERDRVTDIAADDALIESTPRAQAAIERTQTLQAWARETLSRGPVLARRFWQLAEEAGHAEKAMRRALKAMGAQCELMGYQGQWHWKLPTTPTDLDGKR